jgi:hypothetical protein
MKKNLKLLLVTLVFTISNNAMSQTVKPIICKTGVYIKTIKINQVDENFDVQFYWWTRVDSIDINKDYSFIKEIEVINADVNSFDIVETKIDSINKSYFVTGYAKVTIPYKSAYRNFPFDKQQLSISFENKNNNITSIIYIPDNKTPSINKLNDNNIDILNGDQYKVDKLGVSNFEHSYNSNFGDPEIHNYETYSRISFDIFIERNPFGILAKISLPLFVVLFLAYLVFFIPDYEIGTASALTVTALLAGIAFEWTIKDSLPKASYLTLIDKLFYLVYFFIFYAMVQTIITFNLSKGSEKNKLLSSNIEEKSKYIFPILFIIMCSLLFMNVRYT